LVAVVEQAERVDLLYDRVDARPTAEAEAESEQHTDHQHIEREQELPVRHPLPRLLDSILQEPQGMCFMD
jgi:hypothetical protein